MEAKISANGQLTLPLNVREKAGIKVGDMINITVTEEGNIIISGKKSNKKRKTPDEAISIVQETAGLWEDMDETTLEYINNLRCRDSERLKVLGID